MAITAAAVDRYATVVASASQRTTTALLRLWDSLGSWSEDDALAFTTTARQFVTAGADAAMTAADAYARTTTAAPTPASSLIVPDAAARVYDPFDRLAHLLAKGTSWADAITSARSQVEALGMDSVYRTAREALVEMIVGGSWQRRVTGESCDWCVSKAGIIFESGAAATFGHPHCDCLPVPTGAIGDHNRKIMAARGISEDGYSVQQQRARLRTSRTAAMRRERAARLELQTEQDPARRTRLEERADDWVTRRRRLDERLSALEAA